MSPACTNQETYPNVNNTVQQVQRININILDVSGFGLWPRNGSRHIKNHRIYYYIKTLNKENDRKDR